ncbi:hypothetical protein ACFL1Z_03785 [Thermodesulfobacteriota bacterium]
MSKQKQAIFFITVLSICCINLFYLFLGDRPLWDIDERLHSLTSKIMVESVVVVHDITFAFFITLAFIFFTGAFQGKLINGLIYFFSMPLQDLCEMIFNDSQQNSLPRFHLFLG